MKCTDVKFRHKNENQHPNIIAKVSIVLDNCIRIDNCNFYVRENGSYGVRLPAHKVDGCFYTIVKIFDMSTKESIVNEVVRVYKILKSKGIWKEDK